jgi:hypothetical protein
METVERPKILLSNTQMNDVVEAVEVPCFSKLKHVVEAMEVRRGPQTVLTLVGGSNGI